MNVLWVQRLAPMPLPIGLMLATGLLLIALFMAPMIVFGIGLLVLLFLYSIGAGLGALLGMVGVEAASAKLMSPVLGLLFLALVCAVVAAAVTAAIRQIIVNWAPGAAPALATLGSLALSIGSWVRVGQMASPRSATATLALLLLCIGSGSPVRRIGG